MVSMHTHPTNTNPKPVNTPHILDDPFQTTTTSTIALPSHAYGDSAHTYGGAGANGILQDLEIEGGAGESDESDHEREEKDEVYVTPGGPSARELDDLDLSESSSSSGISDEDVNITIDKREAAGRARARSSMKYQKMIDDPQSPLEMLDKPLPVNKEKLDKEDAMFGQVLGDGLMSMNFAMDDIVEDMAGKGDEGGDLVGGTTTTTAGGPDNEGGVVTGSRFQE